VFFNIPPFILTNYKIGHRVVCQGRLLISERGKRSMTNPSITSRIQHIHGCMAVYKLNQLEYEGININKNTDNIVPIYSITSGIKQNQIISLVDKILNNDRFDFSPLDACDYILKQFKTNEDVPTMKESLTRLHFPKSIDDIENNSKYLKKIAFLELISFHYSIIKARKKYEKTKLGKEKAGIAFLSVSFDHDAESWKSLLRKEQFTWPQISNGIPWKKNMNPIAQAYKLHWIPTFVLVSPEGRICGETITVSELEKLIKATK
jgi:RecG-like helicase